MINVRPSQEAEDIQIPDNSLHDLDESATSCNTQTSTSDGRDATTPSDPSSTKIFRVLPRELCILLSEEPQPIETLQGADFLKVFFQIERCHYEMWSAGIRHNDLSLANFRYRVVGEQEVGVLSDWDLQVTTDENNLHNGIERIGTVPYMSLDHLRPNAWSGNPIRLYRHDLEAILWILAWAILCYDDGKRKIPLNMRGWLTCDHTIVHEKKSAFLGAVEEYQPPPSRAQEWILVQALFADLIFRQSAATISKNEWGI